MVLQVICAQMEGAGELQTHGSLENNAALWLFHFPGIVFLALKDKNIG